MSYDVYATNGSRIIVLEISFLESKTLLPEAVCILGYSDLCRGGI